MKNCNRTATLIALCALTAGMSSCDSDDDGKAASIVGKWQIETRELFDCPDQADNGIVNCSTAQTSTECGTWEFKTDGNYTVADGAGGGYTYQYETKASGQLDLCFSGTCYPYLYHVNGNLLVITEGDFTTSCLHKWTFVRI